eukprot:m.241337 g.241337  ORF g.241337 m.241337 type:complete len:58 (+) comp26308_c0_seq2:2401-2574(+)
MLHGWGWLLRRVASSMLLVWCGYVMNQFWRQPVNGMVHEVVPVTVQQIVYSEAPFAL